MLCYTFNEVLRLWTPAWTAGRGQGLAKAGIGFAPHLTHHHCCFLQFWLIVGVGKWEQNFRYANRTCVSWCSCVNWLRIDEVQRVIMASWTRSFLLDISWKTSKNEKNGKNEKNELTRTWFKTQLLVQIMIIFFLDSTQSIQIYKSPQNDVICPTLLLVNKSMQCLLYEKSAHCAKKIGLFNTTRK